jgi:CheY-like chemotaxis protein
MLSADDAKSPSEGQPSRDVVHELNNQLGIAIANLDLLDSVTKSDPEKSALINAALDAALKGSELVERLSDPSKGQTSEVTPGTAGASEPPADATAKSPAGPERILVVDDNDEMRRAAVATLKSLGYATSEAVSGDAALALLEAGERFALIFTDIMMPGNLTGVQLAQAVRDRGWPLKFLFTTGFAGPAGTSGDLQKTGGRVLPKPYRKAALAEAIKSVLGESAPTSPHAAKP